VMAAEIAGAVSEKHLLDALFSGRATLTDPVGSHMDEALPVVGSGEPAASAVASLEAADAVVVLDDGKPVGVLTRQDLLGFLSR
jgi:cystathionine beta-synthase